jgi:hypothetical protein
MIAGPPKTGNVWVKHILIAAYNLRRLPEEHEPQDNVESFRRFVEMGWFEDGTIFHQHFRYSDELCDIAESLPAHVVTVLRNPYDTFVSFNHYIQRFRERFIAANSSDARVVDKPIDAPEALELLKGSFGYHLVLANEWLQSGRSIIVRYEELHTDPLLVVKRLTDQIEPVDAPRIRIAINQSQADLLRKRNDMLARHIRTATIDDWKNYLTEQHLEIFRTHHAGLVQGLGYSLA